MLHPRCGYCVTQAGLPQQLQLPLIGLHVRYSLLHSHVRSLLTCGHELLYNAATRGLEAAVRQLHDQLLQQGWAALPVEGSKERSGAAAVLPERDAAGGCASARAAHHAATMLHLGGVFWVCSCSNAQRQLACRHMVLLLAYLPRCHIWQLEDGCA